MKLIVLAISLTWVLSSCKTLPHGRSGAQIKAFEEAGHMKSLAKMNDYLRSSFFSPQTRGSQSFHFVRDVLGFEQAEAVEQLLARNVSTKSRVETINSEPNAMNMLTIQVVMYKLAENLASVCQQRKNFLYWTDTKQLFKDFFEETCAGRLAGRSRLLYLWSLLHGEVRVSDYEAFEAWSKEFADLAAANEAQNISVVLTKLFYTALMQPKVILN